MNLQLTGTNRSGSPTLLLSGGNSTTFAWSPFGGGEVRTERTASLPGFNGERQDPLSGVTHLGNGYRAYSPALRRFTCPDSASPFGIGGINPYVYCDHDPVNKTDPSGHGPITWLIRKVITLGVRLGIASAETADSMAAGLATAGTVETGTALSTQVSTGVAQQIARARGNTAAAAELGWATMGMGLAGGLGLAEGDIQRTLKGLRGAAKSYDLTKETSSEVSSLFGAEGSYKKIGDDVSEVRESLMDENSHREPLRSRSSIQESPAENNLVNNAEFSLSDRNGNVMQNRPGEARSFEGADEYENVRGSQSGSDLAEAEMPQLPKHIVQGQHKGTRLDIGAVFDPGELSSSSRGSGRHVTGKALHKNVLNSWASTRVSEVKLKPGAARYSYLV
ncbi:MULTISPECIES: RHS repeat-associated core domain-containing protein [Pseudescherichia]|uniref:RHS repeat-associated core domain-containing protein n=1 Tax=Pseudescherichia TaxID=2055880 RepID=UPI001EDF645A|nr:MULTISPECIES: RHS repeat-associated core domain-containing protein [Pseudescherichia]